MTAPALETTTAAAELVRLAEAYTAGDLPPFEVHQAVDRIAHPSLMEADVWARFEQLVMAVQLADDINEGRIDWRQVCDELTGPEPSTTAYEIACDHVADATQALLRSAR